MGVFEVLTIVANITFALMLLAIVPIGWFMWADPSRSAPSLLKHAQRAHTRGDHQTARRLAFRAMSFPRRGRYSDRQATTTLQSLNILYRMLQEGAPPSDLPGPAMDLRDRLQQGQRDVGDLAARADQSLQDLPEIEPR